MSKFGARNEIKDGEKGKIKWEETVLMNNNSGLWLEECDTQLPLFIPLSKKTYKRRNRVSGGNLKEEEVIY